MSSAAPDVERLWRVHASWLLSYAVWLIGDRPSAEDLLQSLFVRFLEKGVPPGMESERDYLTRAIRNDALNLLRGRRRAEKRRDHFLGLPPPEPPVEAAKIELRARIESALRELGEEQRETVFLRIWGNLSFSEIAGTLGISEEAAEHRYYRGLESLEQKLESPHE